MTPEERNGYSKTLFARHPEFFPEDRRASILSGVVVLGMSPFEARLAGGAFSYKVIADRVTWPEHYDPLEVMRAQSTQADDSEIWMTFKNSSQFPGNSDATFRVYFERGRAVNVERLED